MATHADFLLFHGLVFTQNSLNSSSHKPQCGPTLLQANAVWMNTWSLPHLLESTPTLSGNFGIVSAHMPNNTDPLLPYH